jgi:hypothetical protein
VEALEDRTLLSLNFTAGNNYLPLQPHTPPPAFLVGVNPQDVTVGDFTGNGRLDYAVTNTTTNNVSIYLGNGDGTFKFNGVFGAGTSPEGIAAADLIGNGIPDLIVANNTSVGNVSVLFGNGDGTFAPAQVLLSGAPSAFDVYVGDFNNDGIKDIAVANTGDSGGNGSAVGILIGTGGGSFLKAVTYAAGKGSRALAPMFDKNGQTDLAVSNFNDNTVSLLLSNGNGTFKLSAQAATKVGNSPLGLAVGDFNGDGNSDDLAVASSGSALVNIILGNGNGTLGGATNLLTGVNGAPSDVVAGDFNGDGKTDVSFVDTKLNVLGLFLGNGNGSFNPAFTTIGLPPGPAALATADFNGDGKLDLLTANGIASETSTILLGNGNGTFVTANNFAVDVTPVSIAEADFNNDGNLDVVTADQTFNDVSVSFGLGNGQFGQATLFGVGNGPTAVTAADLLGNGNQDIIVANGTDGTITILFGEGNGKFNNQTTIQVGTDPVALATGNFDNNPLHLPDIAVVNKGSNNVSILLNNGDGTFSTSINPIPTDAGPDAITVGDFNGDSKLDLATANATNSDVSILIGNGNGTFTQFTNIGVGLTPTSIASADFNKDGAVDLVTANSGSNTVSVLINNNDGSGNFQPALNYAVGTKPTAVAVGDFNGTGNLGDGFPDIVTANAGSNDVSMLINNGDGTFPIPLNFLAGVSPSAITAGVFTGNGAQDLAVANSGSANFSVLLSEPEMPLFHVTGPTSVTAGQTFTLTVSAFFASDGSTDTSYTGTVHFTSSDPQAALPTDFTFTGADKGVHTFIGVILKTSGPQTITATDTFLASITGTTIPPIQVNPAAASLLTVSAPATVTAGTAFTVTITALDPFGNVATGYLGTIHFSTSDAKGVVPANYTFVSADLGIHTFTNLTTLETAGTQTLTAVDTVKSGVNGSTGIIVNAAAGVVLILNAPAGATAGSGFPVTVSIFDSFGNLANTFTDTVHFSSSDPRAALPSDYTFTSTDAGVHTFANVTLDTAGNQSIAVSDISNIAISGSVTVLVSAAGLNHFNVSALATIGAGVAFNATVTAVDLFGNTVTSYGGTIHFSTSSAQASLPADYTFLSTDQGTHVFSGLLLDTAGSQTLSVGDTIVFGATGQASVLVTPAAATHLQLSVPVQTTGSLGFTLTVTALDQFNNVATSYAGTVHFSSSDTKAVLPSNYTFVSLDAGIHNFTITLNLPGTQSVTATDTVNASITGTTSTLVRLQYLATGADAGGGPEVKVYNAITGQVLFDFYAYDPRFMGGVRVAVADVNGDGIPDIITAPGPGGGPDVRVFDGSTGILIREFMAYDPRFLGGVYVAAADFTGSGQADVVTGADAGGGPEVKVFDTKTNTVLFDFMAYNPAFPGGVRVATGDVNGDGVPDIITGAGPGGGPHVQVFSGKDLSLLKSFMAYDPGYTGGVFVAAGPTTNDGKADILVGPGSAGAGHVMVQLFSGADLSILQSFSPFNPGFGGSVRVALADVTGSGLDDIITAAGSPGGPQVLEFNGMTLAQLDSFFAYNPAFLGGVFVGGG